MTNGSHLASRTERTGARLARRGVNAFVVTALLALALSAVFGVAAIGQPGRLVTVASLVAATQFALAGVRRLGWLLRAAHTWYDATAIVQPATWCWWRHERVRWEAVESAAVARPLLSFPRLVIADDRATVELPLALFEQPFIDGVRTRIDAARRGHQPVVDLNAVSQRMRALLDAAGTEYHAWQHRPVLSYADAALARCETGYQGTESKTLFLRVDDAYAMALTLAGRRLDMATVRRTLDARGVRVASAEELREQLGAEPGAAYPFGFDSWLPIVVDPVVFGEEWVLVSAGPPTETLQIRGRDLPALFESLANTVHVLPGAPAEEPA